MNLFSKNQSSCCLTGEWGLNGIDLVAKLSGCIVGDIFD